VTDDDPAALAARLLEAHRRVRSWPGPEAEKARATRRLLAISDASKHDVRRAAKRLDAFLSDLDEGRVSAAEDRAGPEDA
jgi:hypothetical protein